MPWFKVDDSLWGHPKWVSLPAGAKALWVTAGSWSSSQLTDGFIPRRMLAMFGAKTRDAEYLVAAKMWDAAGEDYRFHDWLVFQPSKEAVEADRRADAARKAVGRNPSLRAAIRERDGDACRYCGKAVHWTDKRGAIGGTYDHVDPNGPSDLDNLVVCCRGCNTAKGRRTPGQAGMKLRPIQIRFESAVDLESDCPGGVRDPRPDPTRPDPTRILPTEESSQVSSPAKRGTRLPDDWRPTEEMISRAQTEFPTVDISVETDAFRDWWRAKPGKDAVKLDWGLTWQGWMRRTHQRNLKSQPPPRNGNGQRYYGRPGERKSMI